MLKNISGIFVFMLFWQCLSFAQEENVYRNFIGHFSFTLPQGWEKIVRSEDEIKKIYKSLIEEEPLTYRKRLPEEFGIKKKDNGFMSFPRMYLNVYPFEKKSERELKKYLKDKEKMLKVFYLNSGEYKRFKQRLKVKSNPSFFDFVQFSEFSEELYDAEKSMLISKRKGRYRKDVGTPMGINANVLFNYGEVNISFSTTEENLQNDLVYFEQIISSFNFDVGYAYQGNNSRR